MTRNLKTHSDERTFARTIFMQARLSVSSRRCVRFNMEGIVSSLHVKTGECNFIAIFARQERNLPLRMERHGNQQQPDRTRMEDRGMKHVDQRRNTKGAPDRQDPCCCVCTKGQYGPDVRIVSKKMPLDDWWYVIETKKESKVTSPWWQSQSGHIPIRLLTLTSGLSGRHSNIRPRTVIYWTIGLLYYLSSPTEN